MIKIGIECESLEDPKSRWGIGQLVLNLLEEYAEDKELQKNFKLYLYFKNKIPDDKIFNNSVFVKRIAGIRSFNVFYHILMPIRAMMDKLDWMFFPAYMLPPLYFKRSIVQLTNDVYYEYKYGFLPFKYRLAYRLFTNWAAIKAEKIMAMSEASKNELIKLYRIKPDKIFVNYLGTRTKEIVSDERLPINKEGNELLISGHNLLINGYILYVGQMFPRRHAKETITAFRQIADDYPELKLILVGRDKYPTPIIPSLVKEINAELGSERIIHFDYLENYNDIRRLYSKAKLFIYVSDHEAFGLPPVEAASYGVPVVVRDNELNHELFEDAAFFAKNDIASAIKEGLSNDKKRDYCSERYKEIIPRLNWHNFAERFFNNCR